MSVAVEYLDYRRSLGECTQAVVRDTAQALEREGWDVGRPDEVTPDAAAEWLAGVYINYVALPEEDDDLVSA